MNWIGQTVILIAIFITIIKVFIKIVRKLIIRINKY